MTTSLQNEYKNICVCVNKFLSNYVYVYGCEAKERNVTIKNILRVKGKSN